MKGRGPHVKWMKQIDRERGTVTYSVIQGYRMRNRLKQYGFRWVPTAKKWVYTISLTEKSRIEEIERDLRGSESTDFGPIGPVVVRG